MSILDGGRDAPMGPRDQRLFMWLFIATVGVGVAVLVLALAQ